MLRVITGTYRGMHLSSVPGLHTRPTQDRVKEAIFSILGDRVDGATVLDLFSGTGSLGIEALSRGASEIVFVENAQAPLKALRQNIARVDESSCKVLPVPIQRALPLLAREGKRFDLIFMDPPYGKKLVDKTLSLLVQHSLLTETGQIVAEHETRAVIPKEIGTLFRIDSRKYGDTSISFYSILEE